MSIEFKSKCSTCLSEAVRYYKLIDDVEECYNILEMLDCIVPQINVTKLTSQFSTVVCQKCVEKLLASYKFQQMCIKSNNILQNLLATTVIDNEKVKKNLIDPLTTETDQNIKKKICEETAKKMGKKMNSYNSRFLDNRSDDDSSSSISQIQLLLNELMPKNSVKDDVKIEHINLRHFQNFQCRKCPKSFEKQNSLAAHCKIHKKKEILENKTKTLESDSNEFLDLSVSLQDRAKHIIEQESQTIIKDYIESAPQDIAPNDKLNNYLVVEPGERETNVIASADTALEESKRPNKNKDKYVFACKICGKIFDRSSNLRRHNSVHSLVRPHGCEICKYRFTDEKVLKAHLFQHKNEAGTVSQTIPEGYKCEVCQRNFMTMKQLSKHFKNKHPDVNMHNCEYCNRKFILQPSLWKHIHHHHKSDKNLTCQICKKVFANVYRLKQHMLLHSSYLCTHCGKSFNGAYFRQHMERHAGQQKYQCPDCPKRFNCRSDVIKHASAHSNAKPYICDICGSCFTRKYAMQKHRSLHTAERSFKCDQCNMTFKLISLLKRHLRTHTGEKPYKCKYCERAYSESGDLTKHLRTHVGENTYICDQCPKAFKYQVELRQHQSQHYRMDHEDTQNMSGVALNENNRQKQHKGKLRCFDTLHN